MRGLAQLVLDPLEDRIDRTVASANGGRNSRDVRAEPSSAALFALLWEGLADLLGSAAAATLLRRSARRAAPFDPELAELTIVRENLQYRYTLPSAWSNESGAAPHALRRLAAELRPLLVELTGSLVIRHLAQIPELRAHGIIPGQEEEP